MVCISTHFVCSDILLSFWLEVGVKLNFDIRMFHSTVFHLFVILCAILHCESFGIGSTLYCYQCISTHPGCGQKLDWLYQWSQACPEYEDRCVKLIEKKGEKEIITRDCLSSLKGIRTDIPADHYEGCRPFARDDHLANYVNNSIKELDVKKTYYDSTVWCFCSLDNRCNGGIIETSITLLSVVSVTLSVFVSRFLVVFS